MKFIDKINPYMNLHAITAFSNFHGGLATKLNNVIHVAGTNGKGSTVAFLRAILEASGYSVNVFTSPHLVHERERIRIRGKLISHRYFNKLKKFVLKDKVGQALSIFELFMAQALLAFTQYPADFTILEVGLGGTLDATNIVASPLACVITPIDLDHEHILGNTKAQITREKAGIIKNTSLVVTAYQSKEVIKVLQEVTTEKNAQLIIGGKDWYINHEKKAFNGLFPLGGKDNSLLTNISSILYYHDFTFLFKKIALKGNHQFYNAALAIVTLRSLLQHKLLKKNIHKGLKNASWYGRIQTITKKNLYGINFVKGEKIFLDGAHNSHGAKALVYYIKNNSNKRKVYFLMAMLRTKNLPAYLACFKELKNLMVYGIPLSKDFNAFSSQEITKEAIKIGINSKAASSVKEALLNINLYKGKKIIIIGGSLYLIGKVLKDNNIIPE